MFGSQLLEVIIGLIFVYILLSIICSGLKEAISGWLSLRSKNLAEGIRSMLNDESGTGVAAALYKNPTIACMIRKLPGGKTGSLPSYIPSKSFTLALLDVVAPKDPGAGAQTAQELESAINNYPDPEIRQVLLTYLHDAEGDVKKFKENIARWFDSTMERVSGWYKRKAQKIIAVLSLLLVVLLNADTIMMVNALWNNQSLRATIEQSAAGFVADNTSDSLAISNNVRFAGEELAKVEMFGWETSTMVQGKVPTDFGGWLKKILGLLITVVGVSLGAPFWFSVLGKLTSLRATGTPPASATGGKTQKEQS